MRRLLLRVCSWPLGLLRLVVPEQPRLLCVIRDRLAKRSRDKDSKPGLFCNVLALEAVIRLVTSMRARREKPLAFRSMCSSSCRCAADASMRASAACAASAASAASTASGRCRFSTAAAFTAASAERSNGNESTNLGIPSQKELAVGFARARHSGI